MRTSFLFSFVLPLAALWLIGCQKTEAPHAEDDRFALYRGENNLLDILANDTVSKGGTLLPETITVVRSPEHGDLRIDTQKGEVWYRSERNFVGADRFSYTVKDDRGDVSNTATVSLEIRAKSSRPVHTEQNATDWYIKLVASDSQRGLVSNNTQIGALTNPEAETAYSLKSLRGFASNFIDIVLIDPGTLEGIYSAYFQPFSEDTEQQWIFTVRTNDTAAVIDLKWRGLYVLTPDNTTAQSAYRVHRSVRNPLLRYMKLKDLKTGRIVNAVDQNGSLRHYRFGMDGDTARSFAWIVGTEAIDHRTLKRSASGSLRIRPLQQKRDPMHDAIRTLPPTLHQAGEE